MNERKKQKLAYVWAILTIVTTCLIGILIARYSDCVLPIFLGGAAVLFGPITGVLYVLEVKRGVFKVEENDEEGEKVQV